MTLNVGVGMTLDVQCPATYPEGWNVLAVGEAPGANELYNQEGFTGNAGGIFDKIMFSGGLELPKIAKSNVVKRAPDCDCKHTVYDHKATWYLDNKGRKALKYVCQTCDCKVYNGFDSEHFKATFYETTRVGRSKVTQRGSEYNEWIESLRDEILSKAPTVVIACGTEALSVLCGVDGISKYRGSILPSTLVPGVWVVPIIHPSALLHSAQWQELYVSSEIIRRKVLPIVRGEWTGYTLWEELLQPSVTEVIEFLRRINGPFTLDIETRGGGIACVGICFFEHTDHAMCVPIQTPTGPYYSPEDECVFWRELYSLSRRQKVIIHNASFDLDWICRYGIDPIDLDDTMTLFHRMYPELPKGLDFVNMWFTDIPYYKDDGKEWGWRQADEQLWKYNVKDVVSTHRCWRALQKLGQTTHKNQLRMYETYTKATFPLAFEMQWFGLDANVEGVGVARETLSQELQRIRRKLSDLSNGTLVIKEGNKKITDKQVVDYIYGTLGLPPKRNRKTKAITADEDALVELLIQFPDLEVLKAINAERKFGKALNSYIDIGWKD